MVHAALRSGERVLGYLDRGRKTDRMRWATQDYRNTYLMRPIKNRDRCRPLDRRGPPAACAGDARCETYTLSLGGSPLGFAGAKPPAVWTVSLPPGSLLALDMDGLIESTRNLAEGKVRLLAAVRAELELHSSNPARALLAHVVNSGDARDDVAVVTISIERTRAQQLALALPADHVGIQRRRSRPDR